MPDLVWPLDKCKSGDPLEGGYGYLDWTGTMFHPAVDLNAGGGGDNDLGFAILCPAPGVVRHRTLWDGATYGYGTHTWIEHPNGDYTNYCHLRTAPAPPGLELSRASAFATCGKSGRQTWAHLHFEAWNGAKHGPPPRWDFWPSMTPGWAQMSQAQRVAWVQDHYHDPIAWLTDVAPTIGAASEVVAAEEAEMARIQELEAQIEALAADRDYNFRKMLQFEAILRDGCYRKRGRRYYPISEADIQAAVARASEG